MELPHKWALQLAYVGNHGVNLWREVDVNEFGIGGTPSSQSELR